MITINVNNNSVKINILNAMTRLNKKNASTDSDLQINALIKNLKSKEKKTIIIPTSNGFEILEIILGRILHCK